MRIRNLLLGFLMMALPLVSAAGTPKYIFYFIGDGMGLAHVTNSQLYNSEVLGNDAPLIFTTFPTVSMATTHSTSSDVTDSAAAGTALSTGSKTKNGMLGMASDTTEVVSVAKILQQKGYGVGIITSVAIDDATPGAFYAHVANRGQYYDIGRQLAASGYEFAAGAALRGAWDDKDKDTDLMRYFEEENVSVHYGLEGVDTTANRLLVLSPFHKKHRNKIGYAIDTMEGAMTLEGLTEAGLRQLMRVSPGKFFMMVEGGSIDHAGHGNDGATAIHEVLAFNDALKVAYDFYLRHPDETLILVTADHETGGMSVGNATTGYSVRLEQISGQKISKDEFSGICREILNSGQHFTWKDMEALMREKLGVGESIKLSEDKMAELHRLYDEVFEKRDSGLDKKTLYATFDGFTNALFNILNAQAGVGWTSGSHTGIPVPVYAIGAGADRFSGLNDNTDLPKKLLSLISE